VGIGWQLLLKPGSFSLEAWIDTMLSQELAKVLQLRGIGMPDGIVNGPRKYFLSFAPELGLSVFN